jgi:hypothetical protein
MGTEGQKSRKRQEAIQWPACVAVGYPIGVYVGLTPVTADHYLYDMSSPNSNLIVCYGIRRLICTTFPIENARRYFDIVVLLAIHVEVAAVCDSSATVRLAFNAQ